MMKKTVLLILAMVMALSLVGCGANNDENNAAIKAKMDEASALADQMTNWYKDNGFLEGDDATVVQATIDEITSQIQIVKEAYQKTVDEGGYSDDVVDQKLKELDDIIATYQKGIDEQNAYVAPTGKDIALQALTEKYNEIVALVNEATTQATANGWDASEKFTSELTAATELLGVVGTDIQNPDTMDEEYMDIVRVSLEEMILTWQDYLTEVSQAYVAE